MPTTDYQGSSVPLAFLGRSLLSMRRNQVISMADTSQDIDLEDLELFQRHISERFLHLSTSSSPSLDSSSSTTTTNTNTNTTTTTTSPPANSSEDAPIDNLLSIGWLRKLLDVFLCCESEFKAVLILGRDASHIIKPPLDRLIPELLDRAVKGLDVCNAITNSIESIIHWKKLALIAVTALEQTPLGDGQIRRAKKALNSLLTSMTIDDKDGSSNTRWTERTWSFGRRVTNAAAVAKDQSAANFRSLSWGVARNWSASKQIHAMSANLAMPRGGESGLALPVYIMSTVLVFLMWALVAAIPCQDRSGLGNHFTLARQMSWTGSIIGLQERITEEWKKKEKNRSAGLLEEIQRLEKSSQALVDMAETIEFPLEEEQIEEIKTHVAELAETCRRMEEGLVPLQQQVREVFHRIVRSRTEVIDLLDQSGKPSQPPVFAAKFL